MSDSDNAEMRAARAEMLEAWNQLRSIRGKPPLNELPVASCSFCGEPKEDVGPLVQGLSDSAFICRGCVAEAQRAFLVGGGESEEAK